MGNELLADISSWQPDPLDWSAYAAWSASGDGIARVIMRASEGSSVADSHFNDYWSGAVAAGIQHIGVYHYAYPQFNNPTQEVDFFLATVGNRQLRPGDFFMLDFEESAGSAAWALSFLQQVEQRTGRLPRIYSYLSLIQSNLQDSRLAHYPLIFARWTFDPNARPAAPAPWSSYEYVQFTDNLNVPGIGPGTDADVFLGGVSMVPNGWADDGTNLTAPNGEQVTGSFRAYMLQLPNVWDASNYPVAPEEHRVDILDGAGNAQAGTEQVFRGYGLWRKDAFDGVYVSWPGPELRAARAEVAQLLQQGGAYDIAGMKTDATAIQASVTDLVQKLNNPLPGAPTHAGAAPAAAQVAAPAAVPVATSGPKTYTVQHDDEDIIAIAEKLDVHWFSGLYQRNMADIEAAARAHGLTNSDMGAKLFAGTVLTY